MPTSVFAVVLYIHARAGELADRAGRVVADRLDARVGADGRDRGQATAEYALILLGAALVALLVVGWATAGGGAAKIRGLLNRVIDSISSRV